MDTTPTRCEVSSIHEDLVLEAQGKIVDGLTATRLANTFAALSDPTRVRLISALMETELCVCDLAALLGMTQSATSHQLRILRNLNLVRTRKDGRVVFYTLSDDHIRELFQRGFEHVLHG
jgi:ArsR family transcriptional regulator, lead/cadmium/zinc/bismuth-responsive transcriptional repressor